VLDEGFVADCPYAPEAILFDEILETDAAAGLVVARMPTHAQLPFTVSQRAHPGVLLQVALDRCHAVGAGHPRHGQCNLLSIGHLSPFRGSIV